MKFSVLVLLLLLVAVVNAQDKDASLAIDVTKIVYPKDNMQTPEKVELGKKLFFDPRLSSLGIVSCNSCHNVMSDGGDGLATSFGVHGKRGGRNAPTVWNSAFHSVQFWDGRAPTLEEQAKGPIINSVEMGMKDHGVAIGRIKDIAGYKADFKKVFGGEKAINIDTISKAIAAYERTLITPDSAFDRFQKGDDKALSSDAKKGWETFKQTGCVACHSGAYFSGPTLPMGTGFYQKFPTFPQPELQKKYKIEDDLGRFSVTKDENDKHLYRVPTLRNVALTAPYFHNGSVNELPEAVRVMGLTQLNKKLSTGEIRLIVAFLNSLTGEFPKQEMPRLPPTPNITFTEL